MPSPGTSAQGAPRTTDYCAVCGESPESATHEGMPGGHAWTRRAASQEAEARYVVRFREDDPWPCYELVDTVTGSVLVDDGGAPEDRNLYRDFAPLVAELNRVTQLRASERERYAELVEVASEIRPLQATGPDWWRCALCGHKERQLTRDPAAMHDANCAWLALRAALAALEEAGSA